MPSVNSLNISHFIRRIRKSVLLSYHTYLSMVTATILIVEEKNNPHIRNLEFHKIHSIVPKNPSLYKE